MRIEYGGAFADLLNEKGKGSGSNEMSYVERTIGFRTRDLDDRDLRLVSVATLILLLLGHLVDSLDTDDNTSYNLKNCDS